MWSSDKGRGADALALRADERRDKLRKAAGRGRFPSIRGCLNGGTHAGGVRMPMGEDGVTRRGPWEGTRRTETSK